ncbi:MAG: DUF3459 domain-containing protein, partial [Rhodothermales bacterium]|nr:DUF3459 domain-containing protein [Rhodothermales bacterium]
LVALNEVGGEPAPPGTTPQAFHARARFRAQRYPRTLAATATHDHKRGEDTRMRLLALARHPDAWDASVRALAEIGEQHRGLHAPARADEFLCYQILAALWHGADHDALPDRLWTYLQKASRESKRRTSWINPDAAYEQALERFVRGLLADDRLPGAIGPLAATLAADGYSYTLSQTVLKYTTPGVPDLYQGAELMDLSLVDPDNRRPVDYAHRRALLEAMQDLLDAPAPDPLRAWIQDGDERAKYFLTARLLRLRRAHPALFTGGDYHAVEAEGEGAEAWLAALRTHEEAALLVVVPRGPAREDVPPAVLRLPETAASAHWRCVLTGEAVEGGPALATRALPLPWAVLRAEP